MGRRLLLRAPRARGVAGEPAAERYPLALEVGGIGALAIDLAIRTDRLLAVKRGPRRVDLALGAVAAGIEGLEGGRCRTSGRYDRCGVGAPRWLPQNRTAAAELVRLLPQPHCWPTTGACSCAAGATSPSAGRWRDRRSTTGSSTPSSLRVVGCWSSARTPDFLLHVLGRSSSSRPDAVAVVVPARDEEVLLPALLDAVAAAVDALGTTYPDPLARRRRGRSTCRGRGSTGWCATATGVVVVAAARRSASSITPLGDMEAAASAAFSIGSRSLWVASADADSVVPRHWLDLAPPGVGGPTASAWWPHRRAPTE